MAHGKTLELNEIQVPDPVVLDDPEKIAEHIDGELHDNYLFALKWRRNREWRRRR